MLLDAFDHLKPHIQMRSTIPATANSILRLSNLRVLAVISPLIFAALPTQLPF